MFRHRDTEPPMFTITRLPASVEDAAAEVLTGMRPWRKAVLAAAFATCPTPVIATAVNGTAGWSALVLLADAAAVAGVVISHAMAEAAPDLAPNAVIGIDLDDADGSHLHYDARVIATEAA